MQVGTRHATAAAIAAWLACAAAQASVPPDSPRADGPLSTRTLEFPDLVDAAR